ncbi:MAG TPA: DUF4153 domain-containing protein, partial [Candidatus Limnocylindrales bacterium]|nr:DUF4153 domain-containing protein [Candidatus Limnocylindrales bacterium]
RRTRPYVAAAVALVVLTGVVLASAALRLRLYQDAYGWTELRFHVLAAIIWLALCLVAAAGTLLAGRTRWLPHLVVVLGLAVAGVVNALGPQATVARENLARALDPALVPPGGEIGFDAAYAASLGDDAVPLLVDALPRLPVEVRPAVAQALARRLAALEAEAAGAGWPSWNLARERALASLQAVRAELPPVRRDPFLDEMYERP